MHGFQDAQSLHSLVGAELTQVCVGHNEVILRFIPEGTTITINAIEAFYKANEKILAEIANNQQLFGGLLGSTVVSLVIQGKNRADLFLSGGLRLTLIDDSDQYESLIFTVGGRTVVV